MRRSPACPVRVDSVLPPAVAVAATTVGADGVNLSWSSYDTSGLFGLEGFRIYHAESDFSDVTAMTPFDSLLTQPEVAAG